jgi:hypothetical protein
MGREVQRVFLWEMISKLKLKGPIGVSQLNNELREIKGFPNNGSSKCKGLEVMQQESRAGERIQNTSNLVVFTKKMGFILRFF